MSKKISVIGVGGLLLLLIGGVWGVFQMASVTTTAKYQDWEAAHPFFAMVKTVADGDAIELDDGRMVRLIGIDAPDRGAKGFENATKIMQKMVEGKAIWLEYDRDTEDKYGRLLAWVWVGCEGKPEFENKTGLMDNPAGCKEGRLVNEEMIHKGMAKKEFYKDRGEMKYQKRLGG